MWNNQKQQNVVFPSVKLTTYYHFKLDFQKMDQQVVNARQQTKIIYGFCDQVALPS